MEVEKRRVGIEETLRSGGAIFDALIYYTFGVVLSKDRLIYYSTARFLSLTTLLLSPVFL